MSVSTNDIKKKITATENMSKITKAMQMVSVAKLGKTENRVKHFRTYRDELKETVTQLQHLDHIADHPLVKGRKVGETGCVGCVVVTTNRGLVGGYNNNLFKMLHEEPHGYNNELFKLIQDRITNGQPFKLYITGQKGATYAKSELSHLSLQPYVFPDEVKHTDLLGLGKQLIVDYLSGKIDGVVMIYQDFLSKLSQEATQEQLLPLLFDEPTNDKAVEYEMGPTEKEACHELLVQYFMMMLCDGFLKANMAEHAARMNTMQNATDNAEDIIKESQLIYNRARQAAITQELNEIVAGANAVN